MICGVESEGSFHALVTRGHARILWEAMREIWPLPPKEMHVDNETEWLLHVLANCSDQSCDTIIILIWHIWQLRSDMVHGKTIPPVETRVDFLDRYLRSLSHVRRFSTEKIIKGKI